jgi:hypothetical protein
MKPISELKIDKVESFMGAQGLELFVSIGDKTIDLSGNVQKMSIIEKGCISSSRADMSGILDPPQWTPFRRFPAIYYAPFLAYLTLKSARGIWTDLSLEGILKKQSEFVEKFNKAYAIPNQPRRRP